MSYSSDLDLVKKLILDAAKKADIRILQDPAPKCNLSEFADSAVVFDVRIWINDPQNGFGEIRNNLLFEIWNSFQKNNIEIPYPQRAVHLYDVNETKKE